MGWFDSPWEKEKNQKEEDYERGQHEGLKGCWETDLLRSKILASEHENLGYEWGVEHRAEYQAAREREEQSKLAERERQEDSIAEDSSSSDSSSDYKYSSSNDSSSSYSPSASITSSDSSRNSSQPSSGSKASGIGLLFLGALVGLGLYLNNLESKVKKN